MQSNKNKIFSGVLFLFIIIIALGVIAIVFISQLAQSSKGTINDNYRTIGYATDMLSSLDEMYISLLEKKYADIPINAKKFRSSLDKESENITEPGEKALVENLRSNFLDFLKILQLENIDSLRYSKQRAYYFELRNIISKIYSLNMTAINRKNSIAENKAGKVIMYTIIVVVLSIIITLFILTRYKERDDAKTRLISTVSHEMKTPISSINLTVNLLEDSRIGDLNKEQAELIHSIRTQSNRLGKMVNEILNFSQVETGNIRLNFSMVNPVDIIDYATTALMILLSEKEIQLETEIEEQIPAINLDIEKTVWVLVNLLSNAIRYSEKGSRIILSLGKNRDSIFFSVKDFGTGISEEDQLKLFGRFSQLGRKTERGWGLGLSIAKEFVSAQGGSIKVNSKIGQGSEFIFSLPLLTTS